MTVEPAPTDPAVADVAAPTPSEVPVEFIGHGGEHGLAREMLCSLPRGLACRLCRGEHDCPFVAARPYGRLVVKRRAPQSIIADHVATRLTGICNRDGFRSPLWQRGLAVAAWIAIPVAMFFTWAVEPVAWQSMVMPGAVLLATFLTTTVGVPLVRVLWRDRGGRRKGGAWKPS